MGLLRRVLDFLAELKRRRVYRATAVYLLVAIGGLELVDVLVPATRLPEWTDEFFVGIAIMGLPVVVVLSWIFDITSGGVTRTGVGEPGTREPGTGEAGTAPAVGEDRAGAARSTDEDAHEPLDPMSVAVLPFENLTRSEETGPFAVGLHHDLLTELSRASALTVISRGSVKAYQGGDVPIREIGRSLGAGTIVEGGVQAVGTRVRLNIQVTDAVRGVQRWAERYDRELTAETVFDLQSELAARIMAELEAELTSVERERIRARPTDDLEAYRFYVRGRALLEEWAEENLRRAVHYFRKALERDEEYALAWAGIADATSLLRWYAFPPVDDAPSPEEAAERAVELGPELAEGHLSRAIVLASSGVTEGPAALEAAERAAELRPSYAAAYIWISWLRLLLGRAEEAVEPAERAVKLHPLFPAGRVFLAEAYLATGEPERALEQAVRGRDIQPNHPLSHFMETLALLHLGRLEEAGRALEATRGLVAVDAKVPSLDQIHALEGVIRAASGDDAGARELLDRIDREEDPVSSGLVHAALGDVQRALEDFERVEQWEQLSNEYLRYFFPDILAPVRSSDRYDRLLERADRSWGLER